MKWLAAAILAGGFLLGAADTASVRANDPTAAGTPDEVEQRAMQLLIAGQQRAAEEVLLSYLGQNADLRWLVVLLSKKDADAPKWLDARADYLRERQRILFLHACFIRSRFDDREALPYFAAVRAIDAATPVGQCAKSVILLDVGRYQKVPMARIDQGFAALERLADNNTKDLVIRWMLAVECRTWHRNEEGVQQYAKLCQAWKPGPALLHQTYANLLDAVHSFEEALVERHLAVTLEPAGWSYDGLGNTLHHLGRYAEADAAHAKAVELAPKSASHWANWGGTLLDAGDFAAAIPKCQQAIALDPQYWRPYWYWGQCLEGQGKKAEALEKYDQALTLNPRAEAVRTRIDKLTMGDSFGQGVRKASLGAAADSSP